MASWLLTEGSYEKEIEINHQPSRYSVKSEGLFLLGRSSAGLSSSGGLGMLSPDPEAPVEAETAMVPDLLLPLDSVAEVGGDLGRCELGELSGLVLLLLVEEPVGDLVLAGVGNDGHEALELLSRALAGTLPHVHLCLLAANV